MERHQYVSPNYPKTGEEHPYDAIEGTPYIELKSNRSTYLEPNNKIPEKDEEKKNESAKIRKCYKGSIVLSIISLSLSAALIIALIIVVIWNSNSNVRGPVSGNMFGGNSSNNLPSPVSGNKSLQEEIQRLKDKIKVLWICLNSQSEDCRFKDLAWIRFKEDFYFISNMSQSWYDASRFCRGIDAHLADVSTAEENDFLTQILEKGGTSNEGAFWLDGSNELNYGQWIWSSVGEPINFTKWGEGEPSKWNDTEHCLEISKKEHGVWNDGICYRLNRFICEKKSGKWIQFQNSAYFISSFLANWNEASDICKEIGAHLAVVSSLEENNFLVTQIKRGETSSSDAFWLDGSDKLKEGEWKWSSTAEPINFTSWYEGEPNNSKGGENCLIMGHPDFLWNDIKCNRVFRFICEKNK